jgi:hypothetical protein
MNVVDRIDDERRTLLMVLMKKVMVVEKDSWFARMPAGYDLCSAKSLRSKVRDVCHARSYNNIAAIDVPHFEASVAACV